jgi:hypothetical protein
MIHQQLPRDIHRVEHYQNLARQARNDNREKNYGRLFAAVVILIVGLFAMWGAESVAGYGDDLANSQAMRQAARAGVPSGLSRPASQAKPLIAIAEAK